MWAASSCSLVSVGESVLVAEGVTMPLLLIGALREECIVCDDIFLWWADIVDVLKGETGRGWAEEVCVIEEQILCYPRNVCRMGRKMCKEET